MWPECSQKRGRGDPSEGRWDPWWPSPLSDSVALDRWLSLLVPKPTDALASLPPQGTLWGTAQEEKEPVSCLFLSCFPSGSSLQPFHLPLSPFHWRASGAATSDGFILSSCPTTWGATRLCASTLGQRWQLHFQALTASSVLFHLSGSHVAWPQNSNLLPIPLPTPLSSWQLPFSCLYEHDYSRYLTSVVQLLSFVQLLATLWTAACQASLSFTVSQGFLRFMSTESVMISNYLILCHPHLLLPSILCFNISGIIHYLSFCDWLIWKRVSFPSKFRKIGTECQMLLLSTGESACISNA